MSDETQRQAAIAQIKAFADREGVVIPFDVATERWYTSIGI